MNTPVTILTTGRVTADLGLKTSQNGKNTKFVQFNLAVNRGYGENAHTNFYKCIIFGEGAQKMIDAKVKKGSLIQIIGDQELEEYQKRDGTTGWNAKLTLVHWAYAPTIRVRGDDSSDDANTDQNPSAPVQDCGDEGLPLN